MDKDKLKKLREIAKTIKKANMALTTAIILSEEIVDDLRKLNIYNNREGEEYVELSSLLISHYKMYGIAEPVWNEAHLQEFNDVLQNIETIIKSKFKEKLD